MGLFSGQMQNIIEWNETRDDILFYMWKNKEIKKNSRLVVRPGQDAIFLYNGKIEGVFKDEGNYEIESEIIPFLTTLKSWKFGFSTPLRAEVLFINTKEFSIKWGTKTPINIPAPGMPGGMPIRCFGTFAVRIDDHMTLIDKIAGIKQQFSIDDVKTRVLGLLDQYLMRWIVKEGKDMFNLKMNASDIARGIKEDLDMDLIKIGLTATEFAISNFNYPDNIQKMIEKNASYSMIGDMGRYQQVAMVDSMEKNPNSSMAQMANSGMGMAQAGMGMQMGVEMMKQMNENMNLSKENSQSQKSYTQNQPNNPQNLCITCGQTVNSDAKFCSNCGTKVEIKPVEAKNKFCTECGTKLSTDSKFCAECGAKA